MTKGLLIALFAFGEGARDVLEMIRKITEGGCC